MCYDIQPRRRNVSRTGDLIQEFDLVMFYLLHDIGLGIWPTKVWPVTFPLEASPQSRPPGRVSKIHNDLKSRPASRLRPREDYLAGSANQFRLYEYRGQLFRISCAQRMTFHARE
jgi:hypothetical protein